MPELPEVETMVRGIRPVVEGSRIADLRACPCPCRPLTITPALAVMAGRSRGQRVVRVRRIAKRVVLELETDAAFVVEPRMTGLMLVADPPDEAHLRVEWRLKLGRRTHSLWFWDRRGLGTLRLLSARQLLELEQGGRLGPDPIGLRAEHWQSRLEKVRRPIKVALLDQSLVAGIGNLYASEILHVARLHPERRTDTLLKEDVIRLAAATDEVLLDAIAHEGSTLSDGTYRNVLNQTGRYQNAHRVYDRQDEVCPTCSEGTVVRIVQAQRSTFYCPVCQPKVRRQRRRSLPSKVARVSKTARKS
ncbi:MAG: bifunctional DNA-formamidopyrimidine glycosylase/DNA-(apurinic or apyrimidinic site) lyase [Planctomycetaceae bacterium]